MEDPAKPIEIDWTKTGTVTGKLLYVNDLNITNPVYKAPPGNDIEIYATIPYDDIVPGISGTYVIPKEKIKYESGTYTIETPVGNSGGSVYVSISDFYGIKNESGKTKEGFWFIDDFVTPFVYPGQTTIEPDEHIFDFRELFVDGSPL